ncbi:MAG: 5-formyltetrahydrofolate cyclo-ligase [Propionibacteriaceae bacterium]|jgi:5-formyltetrahydrofolate cyclo-ligase|nr:5-formyltetrahydrofolate cyclo-ligase [Propionibacteriaceae bacterium]
MPAKPELTARKERLRAQLRALRDKFPPVDPAIWTARIAPLLRDSPIVACYAPVPNEPNLWDLIETLRSQAVRVLLPVLRTEPDWADYTGLGGLRPGAGGILMPDGPRLGIAALGSAAAIILPGLAGTPTGERLGTGGGWYDRALRYASPQAIRVLALYDSELLPELPTQDWDQPVDWIVTPSRTLRCRGTAARRD